eukprot:2189782-Rhodomonas_salina.2
MVLCKLPPGSAPCPDSPRHGGSTCSAPSASEGIPFQLSEDGRLEIVTDDNVLIWCEETSKFPAVINPSSSNHETKKVPRPGRIVLRLRTSAGLEHNLPGFCSILAKFWQRAGRQGVGWYTRCTGYPDSVNPHGQNWAPRRWLENENGVSSPVTSAAMRPNTIRGTMHGL